MEKIRITMIAPMNARREIEKRHRDEYYKSGDLVKEELSFITLTGYYAKYMVSALGKTLLEEILLCKNEFGESPMSTLMSVDDGEVIFVAYRIDSEHHRLSLRRDYGSTKDQPLVAFVYDTDFNRA